MLTESFAPDQRHLAQLMAERAGTLGGTTVDGAPVADTKVLVLMKSLSPRDLVEGARRFAATLPPDDAESWRRSWTRTSFLFGNPANLRPGDRCLVSPAATMAWLGPFPDNRRSGVGGLLKPVTGLLPDLPAVVEVPGNGPPRELWVAVGGLSLVDYLVHLHHTIAEAVLFGRLRLDERVRLCHRTTLDAGPGDGDPAYARVLPDPDGTGRLRLHTWLSSTEARHPRPFDEPEA